MRTGHLTHEEMQAFIIKELDTKNLGISKTEVSFPLQQDLEILSHLSGCSTCQQEMAAYRLLFPMLETIPAASFDFDVAEMVLAQLPERKIARSIEMVIVYLLLGAGILTGLGLLLILTKYVQFNLVAVAGIIIIISFLAFHLKEMIGQYRQQMELLEHY